MKNIWKDHWDMITGMILLIIAFAMLGHAHSATIWDTTNSIPKTWIPPTSLSDGSNIPTTDLPMKFQPYYKNADGTGITKMGNPVLTPNATFTFTKEGEYFWGVTAVRATLAGLSIESTISWSDNTADTFDGNIHGIRYLLPYEKVKLNP